MTHSRIGLACAVALLCAIGCALPAAAGAADIIVRRDAGLSAGERAAVRAEAGVKLERMLALADSELVSVPAREQRQALAALNADPDVRYAEPVVTFSVAETSDERWEDLWALENIGQWIQRRAGKEDADIDAPEAWLVSRGAGQTIGVVDTGVDATHPDLVDRIAPGGRSFVTGVTSATDDGGHGTNVAGVLVATADNEVGIAGVAPDAKVLPLKAVSGDGTGTSLALGNALAYAGDIGLRVVNASVGGPSDSQYVRDAIAAHPRTLYVVPAGNGEDYGSPFKGDDNDAPVTGDGGPQFPCNWPLPNLICVGATDNNDLVTYSSNYGAVSVDLFAPGQQILTTDLRQPYAWENGTSLSAPFVAGEAALVFAAHPNLTPASVRHLILTTVDPLDADSPASVSGGRANAAGAVAAPVQDADGDGVLDNLDDCVSVANTDQADADRDGVGDSCDPTPRGEDVDGDTKAALDDRCPNQPAFTADGCPLSVDPPGDGGNPNPSVPTPTPTATPTPTVQPQSANRIVSVGVKLSSCKKGRVCAKSAKVTVKTLRKTKVVLKIERRVKVKRRWVWQRVNTKSLTASERGGTLTVRGRKGQPLKYRVTATLAGKDKAVSFKV